MKYTRQELADIVERSSTLQERLARASTCNKTDAIALLPDDVLKKWQNTFDHHNDGSFTKRLEWDGLEREFLNSILNRPVMDATPPLPAWAELLYECVQCGINDHHPSDLLNRPDECAFINSREIIPFEEVLIPFILVAKRKLQAKLQNDYRLFSPTSHAMLERRLLQFLAYLSSPPLNLEFRVFRSGKQSILDVFSISSPNRADNLYKAFIHRLFAGEYLSFFKEYAVLAKLLAMQSLNWINVVGELICRLKTDWQEICHLFKANSECCTVEAVHPYLSDLHNYGRFVVQLEFSNGLHLIYKPRNLGMENAYFRLLEWINTREMFIPFKILNILNKGTYGWMETVAPQQCRNKKEVARYYYRNGLTLALLYVLHGRDFHCENLVAAGEHPVLVDLETLFHPEISDNAFSSGTARDNSVAEDDRQDSVLRTQLLPERHFQESSDTYDAAGLTGYAGQVTPCLVPQWSRLNTNEMTLEYIPYSLPVHHNLPYYQNAPVLPEPYLEQITSGFQDMYRFLTEHKALLLKQSGPLSIFAHTTGRLLFRSSRIYGHLLRKTLQPAYLRNAVVKSLEFEVLFRKGLSHPKRPVWWPLIAEEITMLEHLDTPLFLVFPDHVIRANSPEGRAFTDCLAHSGFSLAIATIKKLNEHDLNVQLAIIKKSLMDDSSAKS